MPIEKADAVDTCAAFVTARGAYVEACHAVGRYTVTCLDKDGKILWVAEADNVVTVVGKNLALDTYLAGVAYTITGPYMGLISSVSFTGVSVNDTMSSHAGWLEAGNAHAPTYTSPRPTVSWTAAAGGSKSSSLVAFGITGTGVVNGCFLVYGSGAVNTIDNTGGILYSAGLFTNGAQSVNNGNSLNIQYATAL
jgi:hypothetical protein